MTLLTVLQAIVVIITAFTILSAIRVFYIKWRITRAARELRKDQIVPAGSAVQHGMVFKSEGHGLKRDSQPSTTWFARLY